MSRLLQPSRTTSSANTPSTPTKARVTAGATPRTRTISTPRAATPSKAGPKRAQPPPEPVPDTPRAQLSIKEAIALKRAEARKAKASPSPDPLGSLEDAVPSPTKPQEEDDILGRLPIRETIERAKGTGSLNLATRDLQCIPSALFEMHLNVTPDPLKSVPSEPVLPPLEVKETSRRGVNRTAWYEAQDLTILKAGNNEIQELQHEISMFGSLKTLDLHRNKLTVLPSTIADLSALAILDLSHNSLASLPDNIWALPQLTTLNVSHNRLTSLPFDAPFSSSDGRRGNQYTSTDFFTPAVTRAVTPLPHLVILDASHNQIPASSIAIKSIPVSLTKFDLSGNPLGSASELLASLASLKRLKELRMEKAEISDDSFPSSLATTSTPIFPSLSLLDISETQVSRTAVDESFVQTLPQTLDFNFTNDEPARGVLRVLVGKRVVKEAWEIELEERRRQRIHTTSSFADDWTAVEEPPRRAASRAETAKSLSPPPPSTPPPAANSTRALPPVVSPTKREVVKEAWEIEAEQGLLTEGGRRRARAAAAAAQSSSSQPNSSSSSSKDTTLTASRGTSSSTSQGGLTNPQYYTASTQTLHLPSSAPLAPSNRFGSTHATHSRAFSLAGTGSAPFALGGGGNTSSTDLAIPAPTLPLSTIITQPFADTLKILILTNRRVDRSFTLPVPFEQIASSGYLPALEELDLEGCNLGDLVAAADASSGPSAPKTNIPIFTLIARLFPNLRSLNLSYNNLSDVSISSSDAVSNLILASTSTSKRGLKHLRLRGNKISDLSPGFVPVAELFKGNRQVPEWSLEELDLRDNEIGKLPAELGLMPLDVFLVDGNTFRVPQRRVWEREGTKGLLSWLRGRIE